MAGNNSTGSRACFSRSWGILLANFQMHLRTSSATLNSLESAVVPLAGNGLTIWSKRLKSALKLCSEWRCRRLEECYLNTDIRRAVANRRRTIILMNLDRSFNWLSLLLSVSRSRRVNSSKSEVRMSTVRDSARKGWSQKEFRV